MHSEDRIGWHDTLSNPCLWPRRYSPRTFSSSSFCFSSLSSLWFGGGSALLRTRNARPDAVCCPACGVFAPPSCPTRTLDEGRGRRRCADHRCPHAGGPCSPTGCGDAPLLCNSSLQKTQQIDSLKSTNRHTEKLSHFVLQYSVQTIELGKMINKTVQYCTYLLGM
jgi:hypothetical protein